MRSSASHLYLSAETAECALFQDMGEQMQSLRKALSKLAVLSCMFVWAGIAYAGPSNRGPIPSQLKGPSVGLGSPLPAVEGNSSDLQIFITGQTNFQEVDTIPQLGPVFNGHSSCAGCHFQGALGGGASINEVRVRDNQQPGPVHMFAVDNTGFDEPTSKERYEAADCETSSFQPPVIVYLGQMA